MHVRVIVAGKPALAFAREGAQEYLSRLRNFGRHELVSVKAGTPEEVSPRLLEASRGCFRVVLDERGEAVDTAGLATRMEALERRGEVKTVAFLIGAADGHTADLRQQADWLLALSAFTLQHELALVVLLEQLYRVATLRRGAPYHRGG
jgi:23S rRNA (pseudouridine1915-N3)-methyltransferase